mmetsp:Transcript_13426/g.24656  ORF Transcript_13426/g.24656 Transcript_13426/m.24656 type:complete len:89 (-) Transcript_13426:29-295(-)
MVIMELPTMELPTWDMHRHIRLDDRYDASKRRNFHLLFFLRRKECGENVKESGLSGFADLWNIDIPVSFIRRLCLIILHKELCINKLD